MQVWVLHANTSARAPGKHPVYLECNSDSVECTQTWSYGWWGEHCPSIESEPASMWQDYQLCPFQVRPFVLLGNFAKLIPFNVFLKYFHEGRANVKRKKTHLLKRQWWMIINIFPDLKRQIKSSAQFKWKNKYVCWKHKSIYLKLPQCAHS